MSLSTEPIRSYSKADQLHNVRLNPKRGNLTRFSPKTRKAIIARDGALCVFCGKPYQSIHHITFASAGGLGEVTNGICLCLGCHEWAHSCRKGRKWFERYRNERLI